MRVLRIYCDTCGEEIDGDYIHISKHVGWTRDDDWYGNLSDKYEGGGDHCLKCETEVEGGRLDRRFRKHHDAPKETT